MSSSYWFASTWFRASSPCRRTSAAEISTSSSCSKSFLMALCSDIVSQVMILCFRNKTYICRPHLGEINLVGQVAITHAIFDSLAARSLRTTACNGKIAYVSVIVHFDIDRNSPINVRPRTIHIQVCQPAFNDLCQNFAGFLIGSHSNFRFVSWVQVVLYERR